MKVLLMYDYPASPSGLATQGDLLHRGLIDIGVDVKVVNCEAPIEKEWYYKWFKPDVVVGVGYWGNTPDLILHPQKFGVQPVPWLVANGYIANYQDVLNNLPLIFVTSNWVKEMYVRDGIKPDNIVILPVGCDTDTFKPLSKEKLKVSEIRDTFGVLPDELMLLTVGGYAASKGAQEVMQALALIKDKVPAWKYVCKTWPQPRTNVQDELDKTLAEELCIADKVVYATSINSRNYMPYLLNACDIYAAPSRLEGFGMSQVEANACEKPVLSMKAMGMLDTMIDGETAMLAGVAEKIVVDHVILGLAAGYEEGHRIDFETPRTVDYRANVDDLAAHLLELMNNPSLRIQLGKAGRVRVVKSFDYRLIAKQFVNVVSAKLGLA